MVTTASLREPGLIPAARAGDQAAFDALVGPLVTPAYKLAAVLLRDPGEAEDAVQEACVKAWRNLRALRDDTALRPWFFSILVNQCRSMRRTRWWSVVRRGVLESPARTAAATPEDEIDLEREVSRLPDPDRAALFLFFYLDLPMSEVGRILKVSPEAAKSRVHRAVMKLRSSMAEVPK